MKGRRVSFGCGLVFGLGLLLSGMTDPDRVRAFLDVTGAWDPTLAWVMGGAVATYAAAYRLASKRRAPLHAPGFSVPPRAPIDARLVVGAGIFGLGWGASGVCPGPSFVSLGAALAKSPSGALPCVLFVCAMFVGVSLHRVVRERRPSARSEATSLSRS